MYQYQLYINYVYHYVSIMFFIFFMFFCCNASRIILPVWQPTCFKNEENPVSYRKEEMKVINFNHSMQVKALELYSTNYISK